MPALHRLDQGEGHVHLEATTAVGLSRLSVPSQRVCSNARARVPELLSRFGDLPSVVIATQPYRAAFLGGAHRR